MTLNTVNEVAASTLLDHGRGNALPKKKKKLTLWEKIGLFFTYIFLTLVALMVVLPVVYIVTMAFNADRSLYIDTILPTNYSIDAFIRLFESTNYLAWYGNTIIVGLMTAAIEILLVVPTAYALSRLRFKGRKNYLMVFLVLQMFPGTMSMVAYYVLLNMLGLLDSHLGLVIIFACTAIPGSTYMMKGYLDTIPRALEEAAMLDGATRWQCVTKIILPLGKPMVGLLALFGFAAPFGEYMLSKILLTDPTKFTLALGVYSGIFSKMTVDYAMFAAAAILSALPIVIIYMSLQKIIMEGLSGATK